MSLLNDFAVPCVLMEKKRVPDGADSRYRKGVSRNGALSR